MDPFRPWFSRQSESNDCDGYRTISQANIVKAFLPLPIVSLGLRIQQLLITLFLIVAIVFFSTPVFAQTIDMEQLKTRFFQDLSQNQIVRLLEAIDRSEQLTTRELGAKYKWGYIPPDRTPPIHLGQWWDEKNSRERRNIRIEWFRNHYLELNVERAARELGVRDRLSKLYRQFREYEGPSNPTFEPVDFPDEDLEFSQSQEKSTSRRISEGQTSSRDSQEPPRVKSPSGSSDSSKKSSKSTSESKSNTAGQVEPSLEREEKNTSDTPVWRRELEFGDDRIIYERVGDEIRAIHRPARTGDSHLKKKPDYQFPFADERRDLGPGELPGLRSDTDRIAPGLRFYRDRQEAIEQSSGPPLKTR